MSIIRIAEKRQATYSARVEQLGLTDSSTAEILEMFGLGSAVEDMATKAIREAQEKEAAGRSKRSRTRG